MSNLMFDKKIKIHKKVLTSMIVTDIDRLVKSISFPKWQKIFGKPLTDKLKRAIRILTVVDIANHLPANKIRRGPIGHDRVALANAFLIKAIYDYPRTRDLIEELNTCPIIKQICGWQPDEELPSEATFSRAFKQFSNMNLGDILLKHLVQEYIGDRIVGHLSRDSTAIEAREKATQKQKKEQKPKRKRGRPKKGEERPPVELTRLQRQLNQDVETALSEIPKGCDVGSKRNSKGYLICWKGYKCHIDVADGCFPVNVVVTSASVHDSQVAIPMIRQSSGLVTYLYDLMDSAYDAESIYVASEASGHKPIIDKNARGQETLEFDPATKRRYCQRSVSERANSRLKDEFGGRHLRVRGHIKVKMHLMFGILALFADQLFRVLEW